ncbi:hypothetical protein BH24GEM3_BH24GEM3_01000 [soil metagenome]
MRSLRFRPAARVAGGMTAAMLVISLAGIIGARTSSTRSRTPTCSTSRRWLRQALGSA